MQRCSIILLLASLLPSVSDVTAVSASTPATSLTGDVEKAIFEKTNRFRATHHLPALTKSAELTEAASKFAKFMAESGKYGHRADGQTPADRATAAGYKYCVVRENIAYRMNTGDVTAEGLIKIFVPGWIDSPPHRKNMLAEHIIETGVAVATSDGVTYYAVAMFGRPELAKITLKITNESGAAQTLVIAAGGDSQEVEIPPRGIVSLTECFPTTLSLRGKDDEVILDASAKLIVTGEGIKRQDE